MLEVLNLMKENQQEAKKIINDASIQAEKIKQGLLQKSVAVNEEAFLAEIAQAEKRADELQKSSILGIDQEIKQILSTAEQQAKEIEIKAKVNHEKAPEIVFLVQICPYDTQALIGTGMLGYVFVLTSPANIPTFLHNFDMGHNLVLCPYFSRTGELCGCEMLAGYILYSGRLIVYYL